MIKILVTYFIKKSYYRPGPATGPRGDVFYLESGQYINSVRSLANKIGWSHQTLRTILGVIEGAGLIKIAAGPRATVVTVTGYISYFKSNTQDLKPVNSHKSPNRMIYSKTSPKKVTHRNSNSPHTPLNMNYINKPYKPYGHGSKKQKFLGRGKILEVLTKRNFPRTLQARRTVLAELAAIDPGFKIEPQTKLAYLIQAGDGRNPVGYAYKLLTTPSHTPADWALNCAKEEISWAPREKVKPRRKLFDELSNPCEGGYTTPSLVIDDILAGVLTG